jgi:predicted transcriptional regulator
MKKIMIVVAVVAVVIASLGAVGLAYAKNSASTGKVDTTMPPCTQDSQAGGNPDLMILRSYMDAEQAELLGMTTAEYQAQEDAGKTWLEIAKAEGKTEAEAQTLLETAYSNAIAQALADGKLTQAQADALKALPASDPEGGCGKGGPGGRGDGILFPYVKEAFAKALGMTVTYFDAQGTAGKTWLEIAVAQGKTEAEAQTLFAAAWNQSIDQALTDGKITQAQADAFKVAGTPDIANFGRGAKGPGGMHGDPDGNMIVHNYLEEAFAKALGMSITDFDAQEAAGMSWQEIAVAQGKTEAEAQTLLETAWSQAIDQALADGKITQAQADALMAAGAPTLANVGVPGHGQPGGMGDRGPGGHGGPRPGESDSNTAPSGTPASPTTSP